MYEYLLSQPRSREWEAIKYFNKGLTFGKFIDKIDNLAYYLHSHSIKPGDNVAICLPNIPNAAVALYAVNKCGAIANIVHPMISEYGLLNIVKKTKPKFMFLADIFYEKYKEAFSGVDITIVICPIASFASLPMRLAIFYKSVKEKKPGISYGENVVRFSSTLKRHGSVEIVTGGKDIAAYLHSGGTTGESKTIMLTNYAINAVSTNSKMTFDTDIDTDNALMVLPLFHGYGLAINLHAFVSYGCRVIMMPKFTAKSAVKLIKKERVSIITGVPSMYEKLLGEKSFRRMHCKNFKLLICGGDSLNANLRDNFDGHIAERGSRVRLVEGYGLTEVVAVAAVNTDKHYRKGSVGKPLIGVEMKIVDEDLVEQKNGDFGEILISSPSIMDGYYEDPDTTEKAIITDASGTRWLRSGDCGYKDDDGFIFFKDRIKRLIIIAGVNVFPSEIEKVVSLMPEISMCCAVEGRTRENKIIIKLFVVLNEGYKYSLPLEDKILKTCKDNLISYAVPGKIISKPSLPVTRVGKVDYKKVMQMDDEE